MTCHHAGKRNQPDSGNGSQGGIYGSSNTTGYIRFECLVAVCPQSQRVEIIFFAVSNAFPETVHGDDITFQAVSQQHSSHRYQIFGIEDIFDIRHKSIEKQDHHDLRNEDGDEGGQDESDDLEIGGMQHGNRSDSDHDQQVSKIQPGIIELEKVLQIKSHKSQLQRHTGDGNDGFPIDPEIQFPADPEDRDQKDQKRSDGQNADILSSHLTTSPL